MELDVLERFEVASLFMYMLLQSICSAPLACINYILVSDSDSKAGGVKDTHYQTVWSRTMDTTKSTQLIV